MVDRIVLAHEARFALGSADVRPATRTVLLDTAEIVVEPRVMQVLVALARAHGTVVSRDDLTEACWEGRIVGDDAINRVLSRLRRLGEETHGAFAIETITRIGYRLVVRADAQPVAAPPIGDAPPATPAPAPSPRPSRRALILGAGGIAAAAATGGGLWMAFDRPALPPAAHAAMERGDIALSQTTPDQSDAAVAAFRTATELAPNAAETWGRLAIAYRQQLAVSGVPSAAEATQIESRASGAIGRALALDPDNADALVARVTMKTLYHHWFELDRDCRALLARFPQHGLLNSTYGLVLANVGRFADTVGPSRAALAALPDWPQMHMRMMYGFWATGRLDEADAVMQRAFTAWPRHYSVWFSRQRMLTYTGRAPAALAMLSDRETRPIGIPDWNWRMTEAETRAIMTRAPADIAVASTLMFEAAHRAVGFAYNAAIFHITVGRIDEAYALLEAYFFDRGFRVGPLRYSEEQGMADGRRERETSLLFFAETAALRADRRFAALLREVGFEDYWRRSGSRPDFARV